MVFSWLHVIAKWEFRIRSSNRLIVIKCLSRSHSAIHNVRYECSNFFNLYISLLWFTRSNVLLKSKKTAYYANCCVHLCFFSRIFVVTFCKLLYALIIARFFKSMVFNLSNWINIKFTWRLTAAISIKFFSSNNPIENHYWVESQLFVYWFWLIEIFKIAGEGSFQERQPQVIQGKSSLNRVVSQFLWPNQSSGEPVSGSLLNSFV